MKERSRTRAAWILVAATAAFALANASVYFVTGTFTRPWLLASILVYAGLLAAALVLAFLDAAPRAVAAKPADAAERAVIYRTPHGMVVRTRHVTLTGETETRYETVSRGERVPLPDIEARLDARPRANDLPASFPADVDAVLSRHQIQETPAHVR